MKEIIAQVRPQRVEKVPGCGNKFTHLADGRSEYYINLVPGIKHWDMCASEAVLNSRMGLVSDSS